jgi:hypothetical protein
MQTWSENIKASSTKMLQETRAPTTEMIDPSRRDLVVIEIVMNVIIHHATIATSMAIKKETVELRLRKLLIPRNQPATKPMQPNIVNPSSSIKMSPVEVILKLLT